MTRSQMVVTSTSIRVFNTTLSNCQLFKNCPAFFAKPYVVRTPVSVALFGTFIDALDGREIQVTAKNVEPLLELCAEFGCDQFSELLRPTFQPSAGLDRSISAEPVRPKVTIEERFSYFRARLQDIQSQLNDMRSQWNGTPRRRKSVAVKSLLTQTERDGQTIVNRKMRGVLNSQQCKSF
jgi:hypothetical protein